MKRLFGLLVVAFFLLGTKTDARSFFQAEVSLDYFYGTLEPYGEWIEVDYDVYVWRPYNVSRSWRPYSVGKWEWTEYGWYWESFEPYGWATYHYGRWYNDDFYGWVWMPGYEWGPSWVEWRYSDNYIGWAPLPPYAEFRVSSGIHFSIGWVAPYRHWNFVRYNHFGNRDVNYYIIDNSVTVNIFNKTKYRTNYYHDGSRIINRGVDRRHIESRAGYRIAQREVVRSSSFSSTNRKKNDGVVRSFRPSTEEVRNYKSVRKNSSRNNIGRSSLRMDKVVSNGRTGSGNREVSSQSRRTVEQRGSASVANRSVNSSRGEGNRSIKSSRNGSIERENVRSSRNTSSYERKSVNKSGNGDRSSSVKRSQRDSKSVKKSSKTSSKREAISSSKSSRSKSKSYSSSSKKNNTKSYTSSSNRRKVNKTYTGSAGKRTKTKVSPSRKSGSRTR